MKTCSVCKAKKDINEFYVRDKSKNRFHSQCKDCYKLKRAESAKVHYEKYGDAYRQRARDRKAKLKKERREQLLEYLYGKSCEHCGNDDVRVLEFDHIDPSLKSFGIARAIGDVRKWDDILQEIQKCRILCANCHRIVTAEQQNWRKMAPWPSG